MILKQIENVAKLKKGDYNTFVLSKKDESYEVVIRKYDDVFEKWLNNKKAEGYFIDYFDFDAPSLSDISLHDSISKLLTDSIFRRGKVENFDVSKFLENDSNEFIILNQIKINDCIDQTIGVYNFNDYYLLKLYMDRIFKTINNQ